MASYQISEQLISYNRSHQTLFPQGFVIHSTDTPNATAQNEHDYFNSGNRQASVHYFVDWTSIIRTIPENEVSWHAGNTANHKFLSVEMCEPVNDSSKFQEVWVRTVWLVADACIRNGWNTNDNVFSHRGVSSMYHETDHTDPIEFLASYGRTWDQLLQAIEEKIIELKNLESQINKQEGDNVKLVVVYYSSDDYSVALIASNKNGGCGMFNRNRGATVHAEAMGADKVINIGGPKLGHPNEVYWSGDHAEDTAQAVLTGLKGDY